MHVYSLYICDKIIRVSSESGKFLLYCKGYIIKEPAPEPDYFISVSMDEIMNQSKNLNNFSIGMREGVVVLKKLTKQLFRDEGALFMHGSVVVHEDSAYMFTAPSGTGKTTHSRLWLQNLPDAYILNGDKPFIFTKDRIIAWGTPWCGSERYNKNNGVELKAICFLERDDHNFINEITFEEALPELIKQTGNPNPEQNNSAAHIIEALYRLSERIKFYHFKVNNFKEDAFSIAYQMLTRPY